MKYYNNGKIWLFIILIVFLSSLTHFTNLEAMDNDKQSVTIISMSDNDARSGGDAGDEFGTATMVVNGTSYKGDLKEEGDNVDFYKFQVDNAFDIIYFVLRTPEGIYFDLTLYHPAGNTLEYNYLNNEIKQISYVVYSTGEYRIRITRRENSFGSYAFAVNFNQPLTPRSTGEINTTILGIIIGVIAGIAVIALGIFLIIRSVRNSRSFKYEEVYDDYDEDDFYSQRKGKKYSSEEPIYNDYETPKEGEKLVKVKGSTEGIMCMHCYVFMKENEEALQCPLCNAAYHKNHIEEYVLVNHCCPICRGKLKC